jgi:hypothetical protein
MAKPASAKPTTSPQVQQIHINVDIAAELAAIAHAKNPADQLQDLVLRAASASYGAATAVTAKAMAAAFEQQIGPMTWRAGFEAGRRNKTYTFELPAELSAALRRLADAPAPAAPVVHVAAPEVHIDNHVEVPSRRVIARQLGDGVVEMVPQP